VYIYSYKPLVPEFLSSVDRSVRLINLHYLRLSSQRKFERLYGYRKRVKSEKPVYLTTRDIHKGNNISILADIPINVNDLKKKPVETGFAGTVIHLLFPAF
jgi:hypothetical protein